ncbi:hypothetical protein [Xanthomonas sp. SI]|uniref:hypothetical protein n=1 Tax=Xanthomonas sp. SI TaxID=2724123 RepID=UPI00163AB312|nr:hypothetical protein [Xanthomonas sp. SI]QNH10992.1 hypothetical protein HEP75_00401 [Xanthomonas sp. SI]
MKVRLLSIVFALAWLPAQTAIAKTDPLCAPLRAFVQSVKPDESKSFEFHTSWGGNFKDSAEPAIFAKRCNHFGYDPAQPLCAYLMEHGSIEFSDNNFKRAVMCLSSKTRLDSGLSVSEATISVSYGNDERGAHVSLEFAEDTQVGGMVLKVTADGY